MSEIKVHPYAEMLGRIDHARRMYQEGRVGSGIGFSFEAVRQEITDTAFPIGSVVELTTVEGATDE